MAVVLKAFVLALLVSIASSNPPDPPSPATNQSCAATVQSIRKNPVLLELFVLAIGKNLPYDSGKYAVCKNIEVATGMRTKFFIVNMAIAMGGSFLPSEVAVCLPAQCSDANLLHTLNGSNADDLMQFLAQAGGEFSKILGNSSLIHLPKQDYPNPFNNKDDRTAWGSGTSFAVAVVAVLVALVCCSTVLVDTHLRRARVAASQDPEVALIQDNAPTQPQPVTLPRKLGVFQAFSLFGPTGTWSSLWKADTRRPTDCLNGMRVLSMVFIILGHGMLEPMHIAGYSNSECIAKNALCLDAENTNFWAYALLAGQLGVDTFFFIAGFLLSFVGKSRSMPVVLGTAMRYARLLPLFGFVQMVYVLISPYLAFGPFAPRFQSEVRAECDSNSWWSELLFINAFYPWFPKDGGCMGWSWYLGCDMVFAILGLVILNIWKKNRLYGWAVAAVAFVACIAVTIQQSLYFKLEYSIVSQNQHALNYGTYLYNRPYSRFPCFIIGLVAPWALVALEERRGLRRGTQPQSFAAKTVVYSACLVACIVALGCVFLPYWNGPGPGPYYNKDGSCSHPDGCARNELQWTLLENALWISLSRPMWCLAWLTLALACYFDYTPIMDAVFSAPIMAPLANLTFGAYLAHPVIIKIIAGNVDGYFNYSAGEAIQRALIFAILAYSSAIVTWCLVEKPFATMTGWLVPKGKKRPATQQPQPATSTKANATGAGGIEGGSFRASPEPDAEPAEGSDRR